MAGLVRAVHEISNLARQADVQGIPRVTITFDTDRDRAVFRAECKRQMDAEGLARFSDSPWDFSEATIAGVRVRII
jgi:hypothetical protein